MPYQIHDTFTDQLDLAMIQQPTRINMSYELNINICHRRHKIMSKNNPGDKTRLSKRPPAFFPGASLTVAQGIVHHGSFF